MNDLEKRIQEMRNDAIVFEKDSLSEEFFLTCIRLKRFDLAVECDDKFFTKKILEENLDEILEESVVRGVPFSLSNNKDLRDILLEKKRYDLLIELNYTLLTEIKDEEVLKELDILANKEIERGILKDEYSKFKAMKLKKFELFKNNRFPDNPVFFDMFYEDIIKIADEVHYAYNDYEFYIKCMKMGNFELAEKTKKNSIKAKVYSIDTKLLDGIVKKYWDKVVKYNEKNLSDSFKDSADLFNYYVQNNMFDKVMQFSSRLLTKDVIESHENEIIKSINDKIPNNNIHNKNLFNLCLKYKKYDLCAQFDIELSKEVIEKHGQDIIKYLKEIPFRLKKSQEFFKLALYSKRSDLIQQFSEKVFTDEIIEKDGEKLIKAITNKIPYFLADNPKIFKLALYSKRYDLIPKFHKEACTDEIIEKDGEKLIKAITNEIPYFLDDNPKFLKLALYSKRYDLIPKFSEFAFTDEVVEEAGEELIKALTDKVPDLIADNPKFFKLALYSKKSDLIQDFSLDAFTDEFIKENADALLEQIGFLQKSEKLKILLEYALENDKLDKIPMFNPDLFNKDLINKYYKVLINNDEALNFLSENQYLFEKLLKEGLYDYASKMNISDFSSKYINNNYDELLKIIRINYKSNVAKAILNNSKFINKFIKDCTIEEIGYIDKKLFNNKLEEYYPKLIDWIITYNDEQVPFELVNSINLKIYCKENKLDKLFLNFVIKAEWFSFSNTISEQLMIQSKISGNTIDEIADIYAPLLEIDKSRLKEKLKFLYSKNDEIFETLIPIMLKDEVSLNPKDLLTISLYPDLQQSITKLNPKELPIINKILECTRNSEVDDSPIIYNVLNNLKYYNNLINNIDNLDNEQIKNLIYILQRKNNIFEINNKEDLTNENLLKKMQEKFQKFEDNLPYENNINNISNMILLKEYGIDLKEAKFICKRYCKNIDIVLNSNLDSLFKEILKDISDTIHCNDIEKLKFLYKKSDMIFPDFDSMLHLESYMREEYAKLYNEKLYKTKDSDLLENNLNLIENVETLDKMKNISYKGKKPKVYLLHDDFNLEIHSLGAYSDYIKPDNFLEDWNRPKIRNHGICTSYIGNNQIANARAYHPILGFDNIDRESLLLSANYDIGSIDANISYAISKKITANFLPPDEMINNTRHTHNEMVRERMKYANGKISKEMPSYIVYVIDDVNNKYNFMPKEDLIEEFKKEGYDDGLTKENNDTDFLSNLLNNKPLSREDRDKITSAFYYEEVLQASTDMDLPIVIVDRLYYAKKEKQKCIKEYDELLQTQNPKHISNLLLTYFNNMIGCIDYTYSNKEYCKYFNEKDFDQLFDKLEDDINNIDNNKTKLNLFNKILEEIDRETNKRESFKGGVPMRFNKLDIYKTKTLQNIEHLKLLEVEDTYGKNK